jgi:hypothetical protein
MEYARNDPHSKTVSFDASKRDRDERLNRLNREFADDDRKAKSSVKHSQSKYDDDDDDDDDIVAMMDKMNRK